MRRYLFFVNQPYAYSILRPLQEAIRKRGDSVVWFVAGCTTEPLAPDELRLKTVTEVMEYQPDATFVPGDWVPYFFPGIKVEVFHGIARNKRGHGSENESDHYRIRGWFDLYCTHADKDTAKFQALAKQYGHFAVAKTGWPKLDPLFLQSSSKPSRTSTASIKTVFYASTFSRSITSAPDLVDEISRLSQTGRWRFIVTLHPKIDQAIVEQYRAIENENLRYVESDEPLLPAMNEADIMLCDTSSIMFEFMFLDKPVVTLRTRTPGPYLIDVASPDAIEAALIKAAQRPESLMQAMHNLCSELHSFRDGCASERVLDAVDDFLAHQQGKLKKKPLNVIRKLKVRHRLRKALKTTD